VFLFIVSFYFSDGASKQIAVALDVQTTNHCLSPRVPCRCRRISFPTRIHEVASPFRLCNGSALV